MRDAAPSGCRVSASAIRTVAVRPVPARERARPVRGHALPAPACRATSAARASSAISTTRSRAKCASPAGTSRRKRSSPRRLLGPGMVVVDVGANWGYFTLVCAHLVGRTGRVIALEPHPRLASMLAENVAENAAVAGRGPSRRGRCRVGVEGVCRLRRARRQLGRVARRAGGGGGGLRVADGRA